MKRSPIKNNDAKGGLNHGQSVVQVVRYSRPREATQVVSAYHDTRLLMTR